MKAIIIDDEKRARILLKAMLEDHCPEVTVLNECADLLSGVQAIKRIKPELVFLDIEMPENSGLELLDHFKDADIDFSVIFVTAYNEYAIQAFKLSAVDYILKPINPESLIQAVQQHQKIVSKNHKQLEILKINL
jgi:two-component system LytT family response regulator